MKKILGAVFGVLLAANTAHALCNLDPTVTFSGYIFGSTGIANPGDEIATGWEITNNDFTGCAPRQFQFYAFLLSGIANPGTPSPNYIVVKPPPPGQVVTLNGLSFADIVALIDTKANSDPTTCRVSTSQTPPFVYQMEFLVKDVSTNKIFSIIKPFTILDTFGNTCAR